MSRQFNIYSNGSPNDFHMVDGEGRAIEHVGEASIRFEFGQVPKVDLTVLPNEVNVKAFIETVWFFCPKCENYHDHECPPGTVSGVYIEPDDLEVTEALRAVDGYEFDPIPGSWESSARILAAEVRRLRRELKKDD